MLHGKARYEGGLGQLDSTQQQVTDMQNTLKQLQPKLITATQDIQKMLADVEKENQEVAEFEKVVKVDEAAAQVRMFNRDLRKNIYIYIINIKININNI